MKKSLAIATVLLLAGLCVLAWRRYGPCASVIEKRVASVGASTLEADFDAWPVDREQTEKALTLGELPGSMQALRPQRAFLSRDGVYIVLKERFNEADGVFIAAARVDDGRKSSSDPAPQFHRLGPRVFRYHKCE